ncbi:hypothetical protein DL89DRAFT_265976 [Linderina pennispora]|uniref:Uncharacterized protein n=1 Tax=Linderina pennispora TaxID=61395 RepID=A0A1Y1WFY9_9FUNG|nr:uncharacterized protein DL89DRAFT_265976 [Linderina pennispora]ORX72419.1 hypothetical protein DL89DRAFT_265976 [Linderina pennispora]
MVAYAAFGAVAGLAPAPSSGPITHSGMATGSGTCGAPSTIARIIRNLTMAASSGIGLITTAYWQLAESCTPTPPVTDSAVHTGM